MSSTNNRTEYGAVGEVPQQQVNGVNNVGQADSQPPPFTPAPAATTAIKPRAGMSNGGPLFLENPDGTITEAIPFAFGREVGTAPASKLLDRLGHFGSITTRRADGDADSDGGSSGGNLSDAAAATMYQEVDFLYSRHERVLMVLLFAQFALEILYDTVFVMHLDRSVFEFTQQYGSRISNNVVRTMFWIIFALQVAYTLAYYCIAVVAMWTKRPKHYRLFANWSLFGIVGLVLLAYVDKFNLVIFFLRLLAYIYARFLQGLTASLALLPPGGTTNTVLA